VSWTNRIKQMFRDPAGTSGSMADPAVRALRDAAADAQRSRLPQMAAALSYRTIFGLIPVLVVGLVLVRAYTSKADRDDIITKGLSYSGVSAIALRDANEVGPPTPEQAAAEVLQKNDFDLGNMIKVVLDRAESTVSFRAIGWIGFGTLLYAAIAMLVEIERAFNQVFRVPRGRSWIRRVVNYWTLMTLGGIGLIATFYVGIQFQSWATNIANTRGWSIGSGTLTVQLIGYAVTVFISTAMLTLLYESIPNTRVKPIPALLGAFLSALLWEAGKFGFGEYLAYTTGYAKLYGSLALVPLFLLWIYYTWLIVLFGLEVTYQLQHGRLKTRPQPLSDFGPVVVEPSAGLLVMASITRAMAVGSPQGVPALALATGLSEPAVSLVVARFAERGLLLRVEGPNGRQDGSDPLYTLARTPGSIRVAEVLSIGFELAGGPEANPVVAKLRKAQIDAAGSETLADAAGLPADSPNRLTAKSVQNPSNAPALPAAASPPSGSPATRTATL
jgi:membrane protein